MISFDHEIKQVILLDEESPLNIAGRALAQGVIPIATDLEMYVYSCGKSMCELMASMDKASFSIDLIRSRTLIPSAVSGYTEADQIEFAIENYFIRSGTIYDRALLFVNKLLELGIADTEIQHTSMVTNAHVIAAEMTSVLKSLRRVCVKNSEERNAIIHHRRYSEEQFDQVSLLHSANALSVSSGRSPPFDSEHIAKLTNDILAVQTDEFVAHLQAVWDALSRLLDRAVVVYRSRRERHRKLAS